MSAPCCALNSLKPSSVIDITANNHSWRFANEMASGVTLQSHVYPLTATVLHALNAGISTPARIRLLREISNCYADRVRIRLSWTRGFIEPVSILIVGALVAVVVIALFLPLVSLINALSG